MMPQTTNGEMKTNNMNKSARYFNYLTTLADLTAIASIMAVQVISRLFDNRHDVCEQALISSGTFSVYSRHVFRLILKTIVVKLMFNL